MKYALKFVGHTFLSLSVFMSLTAGAAEELPHGYARLTGLSSDFGPYVNTGYKMKADDIVTIRMFVPINQGESGCKVAFGWSDTEIFNTRVNGSSYGKFRYLRRDSATREKIVTASGFFNRDVILTCTAGGMSWTLADGTGGDSYSFTTTETEDATDPLCIFARNGGADPSAITIYSFKVTSADGTETKLDLVPCVSPEGVAGFYNLGTAELPDGNFLGHAGAKAFHASDGVILSSISGSFAPYVKTDYVVKADDVLTVRMNAPKDQGTSGWKVGFGWSDNEIFNVRAASNGKYRYLRRDSTNRSIAVTDANFFDQDIVLTCDGKGMKWTKADGTGGATKTFKVAEDTDSAEPLFIFSRNGGNDRCALTLHSFRVDSQDGDGIKLVPFRRWDGSIGLQDRISGKFYPSGSSDVFTPGSEICEVRGSTLLVGSGAVPSLEWATYGIGSVLKEGAGRTEAGALTVCPAIELRGGSCSLADGTARPLAVAGSLTLAGGTALTFDVTAEGNDSIAPGTVDLSAVTAENPVTVNLMYRGLRTIGDREITLITSGLQAADLRKFSLNSCPEATLGLQIKDGALVLSRGLPSGYVRVSGLGSDFGPCVNTGYRMKADDIITVRMFVPLNQGTSGCKVAFGWSDNELFNTRVNGDSNGRFRYLRGDSSTRERTVTASGFFNREIVLTCTAGGMSWTLADGTDGASYSFTTTETEDATDPLYVFSRNGGADPSAITVYSFKVTSADGTETKLDLVPCLSPGGELGFYNLGTAELPDGNFLGNCGKGTFHRDSEGMVLSSLTSSGGNQSVPLDYKVLSDDVIRLAMNVPKEQGSANWTVAFGWDAVSVFNLRAYTLGKYRYQRQGAATLSVSYSESAFYGQDIILTCNGQGMSWTKADGTGGAAHDFTSPVTEDADLPLSVFSNYKRSDPCIMTVHSMKIAGADGLLRRNLLPFRRWDGTCGLLDFITRRFYATARDGTFDAGSDLLAVQGLDAIVQEGTLPDVDLTGLASLRKIGAGTVSAALFSDYPGLDVREGELSFVDGESKEIAVVGALALNGGAALGIDVTADGCDTFVANRVDLTGTGRITINVTLAEGASLDGRELTLISGGLAEGDEKRFRVRGAGVRSGVTVRNGALVTCPPSGSIVVIR